MILFHLRKLLIEVVGESLYSLFFIFLESISLLLQLLRMF